MLVDEAFIVASATARPSKLGRAFTAEAAQCEIVTDPPAA
ncbi:hypothetical protein BKA14_003597 [Actinoplanes abujensis]|uniref:Uncharacterized protein n=1 Tax=Paractinoplanes abujensis TaxID=882441 RepID=A0A7W7CRL7_9ACTN|nr:hypothetical protein [Actinoplanes abujensis]